MMSASTSKGCRKDLSILFATTQRKILHTHKHLFTAMFCSSYNYCMTTENFYLIENAITITLWWHLETIDFGVILLLAKTTIHSSLTNPSFFHPSLWGTSIIASGEKWQASSSRVAHSLKYWNCMQNLERSTIRS